MEIDCKGEISNFFWKGGGRPNKFGNPSAKSDARSSTFFLFSSYFDVTRKALALHRVVENLQIRRVKSTRNNQQCILTNITRFE